MSDLMRIAIVTNYRRKVAGAETYLQAMLSALALGNDLALICDRDGPIARPPLALPEGTPLWLVERQGVRETIRQLRQWRPNVIYCHGTESTELESLALKAAPAVLMAHTYYGTCISGTKTCRRPITTPCHRHFGASCLLHYFPRRCGGRNPVTMARLYLRQRRRLRLLREYHAVLTLSASMRQEFLRHGLKPNRVVKLPAPGFDHEPPPLNRTSLPLIEGPRRLLFLGRMEHLKGGQILIQALPAVASALGPINLTFAGDGPAMAQWKSLAEKTVQADQRLSIHFVGWIDEERKRELFAQTDALVVPSLWPEPYGLVGPEAAQFGVPAAAFDVGGIREWLRDGQTGCLAPGDPPTAKGLADAIIRCLASRTDTWKLADGARQQAAAMSRAKHFDVVRQILEQAAGSQIQP